MDSRIQIMVDQENYQWLDAGSLNADERLARLRKAREKIVGKVKGADSPSLQSPQSSNKYLVECQRIPISTNRSPFIESITNGNDAPVG